MKGLFVISAIIYGAALLLALLLRCISCMRRRQGPSPHEHGMPMSDGEMLKKLLSDVSELKTATYATQLAAEAVPSAPQIAVKLASMLKLSDNVRAVKNVEEL